MPEIHHSITKYEQIITADWGWGILTLSICITFHTTMLFILARLVFTDYIVTLRHKSFIFSLTLLSLISILLILLHTLEAAGWGALLLFLGATDSPISAFVYSMGAFTTYGNAGFVLDEKWRLITNLEAMNGVVAFGLTTAFLYSASGRIHEYAAKK